MPIPPTLMRQLCEVVAMRPHDLGDALLQVGLVATAWPRLSPLQRARVRVAASDDAGLLQRRRARATGTTVSIYDAAVQGIEAGEPDLRYALVCEDHGTCVCVPTFTAARHHAPAPEGWCDDCREAHRV